MKQQTDSDVKEEAALPAEHTHGFEHAVRNIAAALKKQIAAEDHPQIKLGLEIALLTAESYHGLLGWELREPKGCWRQTLK